MGERAISVIGLGKLGAPMAACFAAKGHTVTGVDVNAEVVRLMNEGLPPVYEPGLEALLKATKERLSATVDYEAAILGSDMTFIVVPTPSEPGGGFSVRYVLAAGERIGEALRHKADFHLVVLTSTVLPGDTEGQLKPVLEGRSGKRCGVDFGLCYSPEFVALGSVLRGLVSPDFVLIGESDPRSGDMLASFYEGICENRPPIARMNFVNAELAKISVNSFVTMKISYANMLAEICEALPGADVDIVTAAMGLDSRIGRKYLKGALGYGGPCFPRDNIAFSYMARRIGALPTLAEATNELNRRQLTRLAGLVMSRLPEGGRVGILGLSYKPDTDVVEESQGLELAKRLADRGVPTTVFDPVALDSARRVLGSSVAYALSLEECVAQVDVIVIATPWEEFKELQPAHLARNPGFRPIVVDCWRLLEPGRFQGVVDYVALGIGPWPV